MPQLRYMTFDNALVVLANFYQCMDGPCSQREHEARKRIIRLCHQIAADYPIEAMDSLPHLPTPTAAEIEMDRR